MSSMCGMSRALIGWQLSCPYDYIYKQSNVSVQASVIWAMKWYDKYPDVLNNNTGAKLQTRTKSFIGKNAVYKSNCWYRRQLHIYLTIIDWHFYVSISLSYARRVLFGFALLCLNTARRRYNSVNFLQNRHNRHPIARPWGRVMRCVLWVLLMCCMQYAMLTHWSYVFLALTHRYCVKIDLVMTKPNCNKFEIYFQYKQNWICAQEDGNNSSSNKISRNTVKNAINTTAMETMLWKTTATSYGVANQRQLACLSNSLFYQSSM